MKKILVGLALLSLTASSISFAASCSGFNVPQVDRGSCDVLNTHHSIEDNPFFMKNMNLGCGLNMQLPGLPDFDANLGKYIPDASVCKLLHAVNADDVFKELNSLIKL